MSSAIRKSVVQPAAVVRPKTQYSQAVRVQAKELLFIAGQVPVDAEGKLVGKGDIVAQARQVFQNIQAILQQAGAGFANVIKIDAFIVDIAKNFRGYAQARSEFLVPDFPAATAIGISGLIDPDWLLEVDAVAVLE